jgi:alpha/beta superfamily hydrolase
MIGHEKKVTWKNGTLSSEGLFSRGSSDRGVVICHPHPQMGGSMHNNVVETIQRVYARHQDSTLRFNFRGVGESTGFYSEGRGETKDVAAACDYIKSRGVREIVLAGYSFGAWVCLNLLKEDQPDIASVIFISPPDKYFPFDWAGMKHPPNLIVCGNHDPFCDVSAIEVITRKYDIPLVVIEGGDHFYLENEEQLARILEGKMC